MKTSSETHARVIPTSFDPDDPTLDAFPRALTWRWSSCENALRAFKTRFLLSRLPLFWQIESPLNAACRAVGVTVFHNEVENMPVGGAAIRSAEMDTVLTTGEDARNFVLFLLEKNIAIPRNWFLIHPQSSQSDVPAKLKEEGFSVTEEIHTSPGVPFVP